MIYILYNLLFYLIFQDQVSNYITVHFQVAAENIQVLNSVRGQLPFLITTADDIKESTTEEIRLRFLILN